MKLKDGTVINCKTQEDAEKLLKECGKQDIRTRCNNDAIRLGITGHNVWDQLKENTCYSIEKSCLFDGLKIEFGSMKYYESLGYTITNFKDLFKTESKFKVGDKVRVRNDLVEYKLYGSFRFIDKMIKYKNKVAKIINIENNYMCIDLDDGKWCWSEEMLEKVKEDKMSKCKVYEMPDYVRDEVKKVIINEPCVVVILNSGEKGVAKCCPEDKFIEERGYKLALARAMKEKYLNDVVRQDELIKQYIEEFEYKNTIKYYRNEFDKLQRLRSK